MKANSNRVYGQTLEQAKRAFGRTKLRDLDTGDVRRFLEAIREEYVRRQRGQSRASSRGRCRRRRSRSTCAQLGACLQAAVAEGYATEPGPAARTKLRRRAS